MQQQAILPPHETKFVQVLFNSVCCCSAGHNRNFLQMAAGRPSVSWRTHLRIVAVSAQPQMNKNLDIAKSNELDLARHVVFYYIECFFL